MQATLDTKTKIKTAALKLFVEKGVAETTIRDLAKAAGIAEGTLYRHYAAKEDMVRDLFEEHYAAFAARVERVQAGEHAFRAKLRAVVLDACAMFDEDPTLYRFLLLAQHETLPRLHKSGEGVVFVLRRMMEKAKKDGTLALGNADLATSLLLGLLLEPAVSIAHGSLKLPIRQYAGAIADACERALVR